jgi:hypothetical protein
LFTDRTTQGWLHGADDPPVSHQLRSGQELVEGETENFIYKTKFLETKSKQKMLQLADRQNKETHLRELNSTDMRQPTAKTDTMIEKVCPSDPRPFFLAFKI